MASLLGPHRAGGKNQFRAEKLQAAGGELCIPAHFRCPISLELMRDPVTLSTGITYDRQSIETWFDMGNTTCPATNRALAPGQDQLLPNHALRRMIQDWCVAHRHHGVERIPTPRTPVAAADVAQMLSEVASAARSGDAARCGDVVSRIRSLGKESERNRRCIAYNGAAAALSDAFAAFSENSGAKRVAEAREEILAALTGMFPLGKDACVRLGLPESLRSIGWIASSGDLAARLNAVLVLKEVVHGHGSLADAAVNTDGMADALVKLIREPIYPQATKASLVAIFYMVSAGEEKTASKKFVDMGLVPLLLEILVDAERSTAEKALGVLDGICGCREGRRAAYEHALTAPVLVKKIFRVSDMATKFSVSALWKLCKNYRGEWGEAAAAGRAGCPEEALQVGAFQKLLLLLQVGCGEATKGKASELLKMLNSMRATAECIESGDFKGLKRPF